MTDSNRTVRWGILSTADIATKVTSGIDRAAGAEAVCVASRSGERAKVWADKHNVGRWHGSYEALLEDPDVDAIYIGLPPSMHAEWTIKAAEHKKHVLCEKPLAANTAEAIEMVDACRQHGVQLIDGTMWVHHDRADRMKTHLASGELGTIRRATTAFCFNWDEMPIKNIRLKRELGGGCLGDLGWYCVRAIWWAFDELPTRVYATARYFEGCDINLSAILWYADDRMASFDCAFDTGMRNWLEVAGTERSLVCDDFVLPGNEESARYWINEPKVASIEHTVEGCVQEVRMIETLSDIARTGRLEERWPTEAIRAMQVCDALDRSARSGQVVELDV